MENAQYIRLDMKSVISRSSGSGKTTVVSIMGYLLVCVFIYLK